MEKYKCRFCFKSFINGRALGGHMRSHMLNLEVQEQRPSQLLNEDTETDVSSSSGEEHGTNKPTRKRSKRTRKLGSFDFEFKKIKMSQQGETEQHHSSASDTTTEEDLAFCLIMLSRDKWKQKQHKTMKKQECEEEEDSDYGFKCETCNKVFKSYQALGGHRASHKKNSTMKKIEYVHGVTKKVHQCPICFRVFSSGQALGGHKRSHGSQIVRVVKEEHEEEGFVKERMIDLNLPASNEEEDDETSLVFDEW